MRVLAVCGVWCVACVLQCVRFTTLVFCVLCADKPFLLAGLLLVYGLHHHCCAQRDQGIEGFISSQILAAMSTDTGMLFACLGLLALAAIADAVVEVESEVREQERLRIK